MEQNVQDIGATQKPEDIETASKAASIPRQIFAIPEHKVLNSIFEFMGVARDTQMLEVGSGPESYWATHYRRYPIACTDQSEFDLSRESQLNTLTTKYYCILANAVLDTLLPRHLPIALENIYDRLLPNGFFVHTSDVPFFGNQAFAAHASSTSVIFPVSYIITKVSQWLETIRIVDKATVDAHMEHVQASEVMRTFVGRTPENQESFCHRLEHGKVEEVLKWLDEWKNFDEELKGTDVDINTFLPLTLRQIVEQKFGDRLRIVIDGPRTGSDIVERETSPHLLKVRKKNAFTRDRGMYETSMNYVISPKHLYLTSTLYVIVMQKLNKLND